MMPKLFDPVAGCKRELFGKGQPRLCVWSHPGGSRERGELVDLRHLVLVDVLKRWLGARHDKEVAHLIAGRPSQLESDLRELGVALPDGWVRSSRKGCPMVSELLPGAPAEELFTSAHAQPPTTPDPNRRLLTINGAAPRPFALIGPHEQPLLPSAEPDTVGAPPEQELAEATDFEAVRSAGFSAAEFRLHCLGTHYRRPLSLTYRGLAASARRHRSLRAAIVRLGSNGTPPESPLAVRYEQAFDGALEDDLNAARALGVLISVLNQKALTADEKVGLVARMDSLLGLHLGASPEVSIEIAPTRRVIHTEPPSGVFSSGRDSDSSARIAV